MFVVVCISLSLSLSTYIYIYIYIHTCISTMYVLCTLCMYVYIYIYTYLFLEGLARDVRRPVAHVQTGEFRIVLRNCCCGCFVENRGYLRRIFFPDVTRPTNLAEICGDDESPATWKHGWSKHGSSIIPSKHSIPQDLYSPYLNLTNSARTMFTPTMFTRRWNPRKDCADKCYAYSLQGGAVGGGCSGLG